MPLERKHARRDVCAEQQTAVAIDVAPPVVEVVVVEGRKERVHRRARTAQIGK